VSCRKSADVVFVIDSTVSLLLRDFEDYILATVIKIIERLDVEWGTTRVAAVQYAKTAKVAAFQFQFQFQLQKETGTQMIGLCSATTTELKLK